MSIVSILAAVIYVVELQNVLCNHTYHNAVVHLELKVIHRLPVSPEYVNTTRIARIMRLATDLTEFADLCVKAVSVPVLQSVQEEIINQSVLVHLEILAIHTFNVQSSIYQSLPNQNVAMMAIALHS